MSLFNALKTVFIKRCTSLLNKDNIYRQIIPPIKRFLFFIQISKPSPSASTFGLWRRSAAVQPQHDWSESHESLHAVLPDGIDDGGREVDVKVAQKHNAVVILRKRTHLFSETPLTFSSVPYCRRLRHSRLLGWCPPADQQSAQSFHSASHTHTWAIHRCINRIEVLSLLDKREALVCTWGVRISPEPSSHPCQCCCSRWRWG